MYLIEKMALESVLFIHEYCDRTSICYDCVFYDNSLAGTGNGCRIKRFLSEDMYNHCKKMLNESGAKMQLDNSCQKVLKEGEDNE